VDYEGGWLIKFSFITKDDPVFHEFDQCSAKIMIIIKVGDSNP
jgi:hypothetical protein